MKLFARNSATTDTPIGLDVGARAIKAVQRRGGRLLTASLPRQARPDAAAHEFTVDDARRLRVVLSRRGFHGRDVVIAAPKHAAVCSVLDLPPRKPGIPFAQIVRTELALAHRRDPGGMEVVSWELPRSARGGEGVTVLAAGCPHEDAETLIEPLTQAGFRVLAMDLEAWAMARVCCADRGGQDGVLAVADLGWSTGTLVLIYQNTVVYERQLGAAGLGGLVESLQREHEFQPDTVDYLLFEVGFETQARAQADDWRLLMKGRGQLESHFENLGKELALSVRYAQHQYPSATVERILLTGGGAGVPGITGFLNPMMDVPVEIALPEHARQPTEGAALSPALVVAAGLATWDDKQEMTPCAA